MNTRSTLVAAVSDYLEQRATGVTVLRDCSDEVITLPYALVRIGGAEAMAPGQCDLWDITLLVAVTHDADATTNEAAEQSAGEVFDLLSDPEDFISFASDRLLVSALEMISTELAVQEGRWQHIAGFRAIVASAG